MLFLQINFALFAAESLAVSRGNQSKVDVNRSEAHARSDSGAKRAQKRCPREATRARSQIAAGGADKEAQDTRDPEPARQDL